MTAAQLVPENAIPANTIPVVFLDGYQSGCGGDSSFQSNFGKADQVLQAAGLVTVYFDNCSVSGNPSIEALGAAFGKFLSSLQYANGTAVPQVDVVAHSMGGLIVRAYLSGKQAVTTDSPGTFSPPAAPGIRKAIFLATPHFGTAVASIFGADTQTLEMELGSQFLFDLNTWNQGTDDLRGVDALAIAGNGGTGLESSTTGTNLTGFDDGVVQLTSASIGFAYSGRTRIVPDCHTADSLVVSYGVCSASTPAINQIDDSSNIVGQIITSFITGTSAWQSLGQAIEANTTASGNGGLMLEAQDLNGVEQQIANATAATTALSVNQASGIAYKEALPVSPAFTMQLQVNLATKNTVSSNWGASSGTSRAVIVKPGPSITGIVPAGIAQFPRQVAPGAFVTIYGSSLASAMSQSGQPYPTQLGDVEVSVNGTPAQLQYAGPTQVNFIYPNLQTGLTQLTIKSSAGQQTVNVMLAPAAPVIFTSDFTPNGPSAAENAVTLAVINSTTPLHAGDYVALYLTGLSQNPAATTVTVGGQSCAGQYFFAGHVASYEGLDQVNCQIPPGITGSAVPVVVTTNGAASNAATLNIQ